MRHRGFVWLCSQGFQDFKFFGQKRLSSLDRVCVFKLLSPVLCADRCSWRGSLWEGARVFVCRHWFLRFREDAALLLCQVETVGCKMLRALLRELIILGFKSQGLNS